MYKYILKYHKLGKVKYVSHLDTVRVFGRAMKRANLNISYSQGFNPHPHLTFAHPMGLGVESVGELVEITFEDVLDIPKTIKLLNDNMPQGFSIEWMKESDVKSPFINLDRAEYKIDISGTIPEGDFVQEFMNLPEIIMPKRTKSGVKDTDLKEFIIEMTTQEQKSSLISIKAILKTGTINLKPELLIEAMGKYVNEIKIDGYNILRLSLLDEQGIYI